jgi:hypothetical protein
MSAAIKVTVSYITKVNRRAVYGRFQAAYICI